MNEITVHVVSSASMKIFSDNTLVTFRNFFNEEINLEGDCRVALIEITFPFRIIQINNNTLRVFSFDGKSIYKTYLLLRGQFLDPTQVNQLQLELDPTKT